MLKFDFFKLQRRKNKSGLSGARALFRVSGDLLVLLGPADPNAYKAAPSLEPECNTWHMAPGVFSLAHRMYHSTYKGHLETDGRKTAKKSEGKPWNMTSAFICSSVLFMALGNTLYLLRSPLNYMGKQNSLGAKPDYSSGWRLSTVMLYGYKLLTCNGDMQRCVEVRLLD
jgi:hypothetical protein